MLSGILLLMLFNLLGYWLVLWLGLPVPAAVAGLVLLLVFLLLWRSIPQPLVEAAPRLLPLLPLFLIPASSGVVEYSALLEDEWFPIVLALVLSVLASFVATPLLFRFFLRLTGKR